MEEVLVRKNGRTFVRYQKPKKKKTQQHTHDQRIDQPPNKSAGAVLSLAGTYGKNAFDPSAPSLNRRRERVAKEFGRERGTQKKMEKVVPLNKSAPDPSFA